MSSDTGKFYTNYSFKYPNENVRVATSSFQDVPSNKKPLINLTMNGILGPSENLHVIEMKFEGDIPQKDTLAQSYGTFVLCKDVYNARKVIKTAWDKETNTLTVMIDLRPYNVRPKRPAQFSFSIQINDELCDDCAVKNWKNYCGVGVTFQCSFGQVTVDEAGPSRLGCGVSMNGNNKALTKEWKLGYQAKCPCFNNKGEVQNNVCNYF